MFPKLSAYREQDSRYTGKKLAEFFRGLLDVRNQQIAYIVVAFYENTVVGYVTYGLDTIKHEYEDAVAVGIDSHVGHSVPALRIYQLAVAQDYNGNGIGTTLVTFVFQVLSRIQEILPCPRIVVTAYEDAVSFYERFAFKVASQPAQRWVAPNKLMFAAVAPDE